LKNFGRPRQINVFVCVHAIKRRKETDGERENECVRALAVLRV